MKLFSQFHFQVAHCLYIKIKRIFKCWTYVLQLCWIWCLVQIMCVCVCSLEFSIYEIVSSTNRYSFTFPIPIWIHFISFFSWQITHTRTSGTMMNRSGENRHFCLFPDSRRNNLQIPSSSIKYLTCNSLITLSSPLSYLLTIRSKERKVTMRYES